jgi:hypothetical protein
MATDTITPPKGFILDDISAVKPPEGFVLDSTFSANAPTIEEPIWKQLQRESLARDTSIHVLANESGLSPDVVNLNWDTITTQLYGEQNMSPLAVEARLEKEGKLITPERIDPDLLSVAQSIGAGTPPDKEVLRRVRSSALNANIKSARENFDKENVAIMKFAETLPVFAPTTGVSEVLSMPVYDKETLLDGNKFANLISQVQSKQDADNLLNERKMAFSDEIKNYDKYQKFNIAENYAKAETGFVSETTKAAKKTSASIAAGVLGLFDNGGILGFTETKENLLDYIKSPDLTQSETKSAMNYLGRTVGSVVPYVLSAATAGGGVRAVGLLGVRISQAIGAGTVAYAQMGEEAKQTALEKGASIQEAELEREIVGGGSALLMSLQIDKLFRFAVPTAKKAVIDAVKKTTYQAMAQSGGKLTKEVMSLGINGGLTMAAQEGLIIATPALLRDDYPKTPDGKPDWFTMATQMAEAGVGGAVANVMVGGGFRTYEAARTARYKVNLAKVISVTENIDYSTAKKAASEIVSRQLGGEQDFGGIYEEAVSKYRKAEIAPVDTTPPTDAEYAAIRARNRPPKPSEPQETMPIATAEGTLGIDVTLTRLLEEGAAGQKLADQIHKNRIQLRQQAIREAGQEPLGVPTAEGVIGEAQPTPTKEAKFVPVEPPIPVSAWRETPMKPIDKGFKPITEQIVGDIRSLIEYSKTPEGMKEIDRVANVIADLDARYEKIVNAQDLSPKELHKVAKNENIPKEVSKTEMVMRLNGVDLQELVKLGRGTPPSETPLSPKNRRMRGSTIMFDPKEWSDAIKAGSYHFNKLLEVGATKFAEWTDLMIGDFGEQIRPNLPVIWAMLNPKEQHSERLPESFIQANMAKVKPSLTGKIGKVLAETGHIAEVLTGDMTRRTYKISPEIGRRVSQYVHLSRKLESNYVEGVSPFLKKAKETMTPEDYRRTEIATRNLAEGDIDDLIKKYSIENEYHTFRDTMDTAFNEQKAKGVDMDYRRSYFPISVRDLEGLLEYNQTTDKHSLIEESIRNKEAKQGGRPLSHEQKLSLVNSLLRGYTSDSISLARPGHAKERTMDTIDAKTESYLHDWDTSVIHYLQESARVIAQRSFFGKQSNEIVSVRKSIESLNTRIYKLKNDSDFMSRENADGEITRLTDEQRDVRIKASEAKRNELQGKYEKLNDKTLDESVADEVVRLAEEGKLDSKQQKELQGILNGIFNPQKANALVAGAIRWTYYDLLNNVTQFLTQMGDLSFSLYAAPLQTPKAFYNAVRGKSEVSIKDVYVHPLGQEWTDVGLAKMGEKLLLAMRKGDTIGKETFINSILKKYQKQIRTNSETENSRLIKFFGKETEQIIKDLQDGVISENVKYLLATELAGIQPISIADMPEGYAKSGNLKFVYTLKSFMLKRFNFMREEAFSLMKDPIHKPKDFMTGMGRLIWMSTLFSVTGASMDAAKNFIYGKPIDFTGQMVENFLQIFLLSRYSARKVKEGAKGILTQNLFPTKTIDNASKDLVVHLGDNEEGKGYELVKSIPLIGDILYWRFGEGKRKLEEAGD